MFVADPTLPTLSVLADDTDAAIGDDVDVTYRLTGVPYGTPHAGLEFSLEHPLLDRGMADVSLVSSSCDGDVDEGVVLAPLVGTTTDTPVVCATVLRFHMNAAAVLDVAGAVQGDGHLAAIEPTKVTVHPTLTLAPDADAYEIGDDVALTYHVDGGHWSDPGTPAIGPERSTEYTYSHTLPGGISEPRVVDESDAGCGNEFGLRRRHDHGGERLRELVAVLRPELHAGRHGHCDRGGHVRHQRRCEHRRPDGRRRVVEFYVADPTEPTVTMTTRRHRPHHRRRHHPVVRRHGCPYGSAHGDGDHAGAPRRRRDGDAGYEHVRWHARRQHRHGLADRGSLPGSETSAVPSCTFSATVDSATSGSFDVGTGLTTTVNDGLGET